MEPLISVQLNKKRKNQGIKQGEKVHLRIVGESFLVVEHLDNVPIIQRKKEERDNLFCDNYIFNQDKINELWDFDRGYDENFKLDNSYYKGKEQTISELWATRILEDATDEDVQKHYGIITSSVHIYRNIFIFSETDTHYKLTTYKTSKFRLCGFNYFCTRRIINSIILNKKTGDIYVREATFKDRKWTSKIKKNQIKSIITNIEKHCIPIKTSINNSIKIKSETTIDETLETRYNSSTIHLEDRHIDKIVSVIGIDVKQYDIAYPNHINNGAIKDDLHKKLNNKEILSATLVFWFLRAKQIKHSNNPLFLLYDCYVPIKKLRKHNMNLISAALELFGIKSKSVVTILNQHEHISIFNLSFWYHLLGHNYFTQLNPEIFSIGGDHLKFIGWEYYGFEGVSDPYDMINNKKFWQQIGTTLTKKEKYNVFCILRSTENGGKQLQETTLLDHIKTKTELREHGDIVFIKARNIESFDREHVEWSDKIYFYKQNKIVSYKYNPELINLIEQPQEILNENETIETYYPIILKEDVDYFNESQIQKHCVKTYVNNYKSMIISIRKNNIKNEDRITCEYRYNNINNKFELVQKRAKCNANPDSCFNAVLEIIENNLKDFVNNNNEILPTVIEKNKITKIEKVVFKQNLELNNNTEDAEFDFL